MRIKRFNENFQSDDFDFDFVYHCFVDLLEDDNCKILKKKFSDMEYVVIQCDDIALMEPGGNIIGYPGKTPFGHIRKITDVTNDEFMSIDDYIDVVNKSKDFTDRDVSIYNLVLMGFKKLRDEYPNYSYTVESRVYDYRSYNRTLWIEIYPEN